MFLTEYERNLDSNYLILSCDEETTYDFFQVKMLEENKINGLLECKIKHSEEQEKFLYEISLKQSLVKLYENASIHYDELSRILCGLAAAIHSTKEYLLDAKHLLLHQDYIYMNPETKKLYLCFFPMQCAQPEKSFSELAEYFLDRVDYKDEKAVILAYHFFRKVREENFNICTVMQDFVLTGQEKIMQEKRKQKEKPQNINYEEKEKRTEMGTPLFVAGTALLLLLITALLYLQFGSKELPMIRGMTYQMTVAVLGVLGGIVAFIGFLIANRIYGEVYYRKTNQNVPNIDKKGGSIDTKFQK